MIFLGTYLELDGSVLGKFQKTQFKDYGNKVNQDTSSFSKQETRIQDS